jgi:hypothetical protein
VFVIGGSSCIVVDTNTSFSMEDDASPSYAQYDPVSENEDEFDSDLNDVGTPPTPVIHDDADPDPDNGHEDHINATFEHEMDSPIIYNADNDMNHNQERDNDDAKFNDHRDHQQFRHVNPEGSNHAPPPRLPSEVIFGSDLPCHTNELPPDDLFDEPTDVTEILTPIPLFNEEFVEPDNYQSDWCFLCTHDSNTKLVVKLKALAELYGQKSNRMVCLLMQKYYNNTFRGHLEGRPRWTLRCILDHLQEHNIQSRQIQHNIIRHLNQVFIATGRTSVLVQNSENVVSLNPKGVSALIAVARELRASIKDIK